MKYLIFVVVIIIIPLINLVYVSISINRRDSSIQPQFNSFASWGWCSIFVGFPPTKHASSVNFVLLKGTPEIITNFYNTKSKSCTCYVNIPKSIRIVCYFLSPNFTYAFPQHPFLMMIYWTAIFWLRIATSDLRLWTAYWNIRVS
jgi:hypothetical protein